MRPVFHSPEQLVAAHKLAKHFGLWWARSLRPDEIAGLIGMTADEIKSLCDRAVERDIADGCDDSAWRVDPSPDYRTGASGNGRTRWIALRDGSVDVQIIRPCGTAISGYAQPTRPAEPVELAIFEEAAVHLRHVDALIRTLEAVEPNAGSKVWRALGDRPALFARLVEEDREWAAAGLPKHALPRWRSSKEVAR